MEPNDASEPLVNHENISINGADSVSFDLYYDGALLKDGAAIVVRGCPATLSCYLPPSQSKAKVTLQDGSFKEETMGDAQADTDAAGDAMGLKGYKLTRVTVKLARRKVAARAPHLHWHWLATTRTARACYILTTSMWDWESPRRM